jgi:hypothetical protein
VASSPLPLGVDAQLRVLFLGAVDAFDAAASILRGRASQQVFNLIRFQVETLVLVRWLTEPRANARERQLRAYQLLYGQLSRMTKVLAADAKKGPTEAEDVADRAKAAKLRLAELAREDGYPPLKVPPDRRTLFSDYLKEGG